MSLQHNREIEKIKENQQQLQQQEESFDLSLVPVLLSENIEEEDIQQEEKEEVVKISESEKDAQDALKSLPPSMELADIRKTVYKGQPLSPVARERLNKEKAAWKTVREFHATIRLNQAADLKEEELADMTLADLTAMIVTDKGSKSEVYTDMQNALAALSMMASSDGAYFDEKKGEVVAANFYEVMYKAKEATNQYVSTHSKRRRRSEKGKMRLAISQRVQALLKLLENDVENAQESAKLNAVQQVQDEAQEQAQKTNEDLRKEMDEQTREETNLTAIDTFVEAHPELTLGLLRMKGELRLLLGNKLNAKPGAMKLPPEEFAPLLTELSQVYIVEWGDKLSQADARMQKMLKKLNWKTTDVTFLNSESIAALLLDVKEEAFNEELNELFLMQKDNDALIADILQRRTPGHDKTTLFDDIKATLNSARIFSGAFDLAIWVNEYIDSMRYMNPDVYSKLGKVPEQKKPQSKADSDKKTGGLDRFSFVSRMKGDLLLKDPAMGAVFSKWELDCLSRNITTVLSGAFQTSDLSKYDSMTFREYRMAAKLVRMRLLNNAEKFHALANDDTMAEEIKNAVLLRLAEEQTTPDTFDTVVEEEKTRLAHHQQSFRYRYMVDIGLGVLPPEELEKLTNEEKSQVARLSMRYLTRVDQLKTMQDGRFAIIAEHLVKLPGAFDKLMAEDEKDVEEFFSGLAEKYGALADGMRDKGISSAAKEMYLNENFKHIQSGAIQGDSAFFATRLEEYSNKLYNEKYDGKHTVTDNINNMLLYLDENLGMLYPNMDRAFYEGARMVAIDKVGKLNASAKAFTLLYDPKRLNKAALIAVDRFAKQYGKTDADRPKPIIKQKQGPAAAYEALSKEIADEKELGKGKRDQFLHIDNEKIDEIRKNKSMVMADHRSGDLIRLTKSDIDERRGRVDRLLGYLDLHETLKSVLIERISAGGGLSEVLSDETLLRVGRRMDELYRTLPRAMGQEDKMSEEETLMLITHMFANPDLAAVLYQEDLEFTAEMVLDLEGVRVFRENYAKLRELETLSLSDPSLEQEQREMSRNLRAVLITGAGLIDEKGRTVKGARKEKADQKKLFGEAAKRHLTYLTVQDQFLQLLKKCLNEHAAVKDRSELYKERSIFGFRSYFQNRLMEDIAKGSDFDTQRYETQISEILGDASKLRLVTEEQDAVSDETHPWLYDKAFDDTHSQEDIDKLLDDKTFPLFKGIVNRYRSLDSDQKKLFAIALTLLDKGAIGIDTGGTNALLVARDLKEKQETKLEQQIIAYVAGGEMQASIDYKEALNKLTNYGINRFKMEREALSESAFEKAYEFAVQIKQKRVEYGDKDVERISDGISSIRTAASLGQTEQYNEAQKLAGQKLTPDDVYHRLLMYAKLDKNSAMVDYFSKISPGKRTRFSRMLVRILQDRSVLDTTTVTDCVEQVDSAQRAALFDALSGDRETREDALKGFDDGASCEQALITALSFQLRDDVNFAGKTLTKEHFRDGALNRGTLIDWNLIKKATEFMKEITQRSLAVTAVKDAPKYIEYSGNKKAIDAHRKLKEDFAEPKQAKQEDLESFLRKQADEAAADGEDAKVLIGGYHSLTQEQKNLFVRVLGRRDLLDISKKNLYKNLFFNSERSYVNEAGRYALTDEFIKKSIGGGSGISLDADAHYAAMESLLSTQVDDTVDFTTAESVEKIGAGERFFIAGRKTAVDWKLFRRALSFVLRASDELSMREGNAELYRSMGDLSANGSFQMDYKFLRRNYHNTGGRYFRFAAKNAIVHADKLLSVSKTVDSIAGNEKALLGKNGLTSFILSDNFRKRLKDGVMSAKGTLPGGPAFKINQAASKSASSPVKPQEFYDTAKKQIDDILANEASVESSLEKLSGVFKKYVTDTTGFGQMMYKEKEGKAKSGGPSVTDQLVKGVKKPYVSMKGDIRDYGKYMSDAYGYANDVFKMIPKNEQIARLIREKVIAKTVALYAKKNGVILDEETRKKSISAISDDVQKYMKQIVGEENAAKFFETTDVVLQLTKSVSAQLGSIVKITAYATKAVDAFNSVTDRAVNVMQISQGQSKAKEDYKDSDREQLKEAEKHQDERQKKIAKEAAQKNADYTDLAAEATKTLQGMGISADVINLTVDTLTTFTKVTSVSSTALLQAVTMGAEFALYSLRCMADKAALRDYYLHTEQGQKAVADIKAGVLKAYPGDKDMADKLEKQDVLDLIMNGKGYEKMEELVENTGMSIAQTVVYAASNYNPMQQTRLVATVVMAVLGCGSLIGNVSPASVETVFRKLSAA